MYQATMDCFWVPPPTPPTPETKEPSKDQDWGPRIKAPHEVMDALPAGGEAWTDYRNHDRKLTKKKEHEYSRRVKVTEPLFPGDTARVNETAPYSDMYEARKV